MANKTETLVIEAKTQFGVKANGTNYSFSKFLKDGKSLNVGDVIEAEIYTGQKGGKYINSFETKTPVLASVDSVTTDTLPMPPALPPTTVSTTLAPGGDVVVKPAVKKEVAGDDKMTKKDWLNKDRSIETQAVLKSVLESPAYAQLVVGKRRDESLQIGKDMFLFFLNLFYEAKNENR